MPNETRQCSVVTVLNLKGGVGKTHAVWLLASVAEERGERVLLIDTDPQGNLSNSFVRERDARGGVARLLDPSRDDDAHLLVQRTAYANIDILPSSPLVAQFDVANQKEWEKADLQFSFRDAILELRPMYDWIVFDCPPRLSLASFAALCASTGVIVPLESADWGAQGIVQVTEAIDYVREHFQPSLRLLGYLVSRFKRRAYQSSYLASLRDHFGSSVFDTVVPDLAGFERAVTDAVPITVHSPDGSEARIARSLFDEVARRLGREEGGGGVQPDDHANALLGVGQPLAGERA